MWLQVVVPVVPVGLRLHPTSYILPLTSRCGYRWLCQWYLWGSAYILHPTSYLLPLDVVTGGCASGTCGAPPTSYILHPTSYLSMWLQVVVPVVPVGLRLHPTSYILPLTSR